MDFSSLSKEEFKAWLLENGLRSYIADQVFDWIYEKKITDFSEMTNVKKEIRDLLKKTFSFPLLRLLKTEDSETNEVTKFLWELDDEKRVESVLIRSGDRRTVCVSSQVGCNARCAFCASGKEGIFRNLKRSEIIEQILLIDQYLFQKNERVSHIVFMGMGEPLENYDEVTAAIQILRSEDGLNISSRRITVSTVGIVENILRLAKEDLKVNLVLSLHAPNQHIRKKIIPYARKYPLEDVMDAMQKYSKLTKRDVTYEYILIEGINAEEAHAKELAHLLFEKQCTVNLIPYNPVANLHLQRPSKDKIERFRLVLQKKKIPVTWRYTKGKDIAAACGQLAVQKKAEPLHVF